MAEKKAEQKAEAKKEEVTAANIYLDKKNDPMVSAYFNYL